jgi:hypothetical protein
VVVASWAEAVMAKVRRMLPPRVKVLVDGMFVGVVVVRSSREDRDQIGL